MDEMKRCSRCETDKPRTEFYRCKKNADGLQAYCKACITIANLANAKKDPAAAAVRARKFRATNPERSKATLKKHYDANREKRLVATRDWRTKNVERLREYEHQRWLRDPDSVVAKNVAYLARLKAAEGAFTPKEWQDLCAAYDNCCAYCARRIRLTRHHVVPLVKGGTNWIDNIAPACRSCNSRIGTNIIPPPPPNRQGSQPCPSLVH